MKALICSILLISLVFSGLLATSAAQTVTAVSIDVKPGSFPNSINLRSRGVISVAVLTTQDFDAATVAPDTVEFDGAAPLTWALEDIDGNGDLDFVFKFKVQELALIASSTEAILTGETLGGVPLEGTDSVRIVPMN